MIENPLSGSCMRFLKTKVGANSLKNKRVIGDCESAKRNLIRHLRPLRAEGICRHVYNHGGSKGETARREEKELMTILTLGHVTGYKNPELWIQVAKEVTRRIGSRIQFLWTGEGNLLDQCRKATKSENHVRFLGLVQNVDDYYKRADVYFQPSELENHPISVVEAMKWSLPCVVSTVGGLPECVEDQKSGFVVNVTDFESTVQRLVQLAKDRDLRKQFGIEGRKRFERMFSSETWTNTMDDLISEVYPSWASTADVN
jgi:glycosyltransferase involved in cell wall biosynthesis